MTKEEIELKIKDLESEILKAKSDLEIGNKTKNQHENSQYLIGLCYAQINFLKNKLIDIDIQADFIHAQRTINKL